MGWPRKDDGAIAAADVPAGGFFRKRGGEYAYLRISESSVRHYGLNPDLVYGVTWNGNMASVTPETLVVPCQIEDLATNKTMTMEWERRAGVTHPSPSTTL